ncbi:FecR family protein [Pseudomonas sp. RIT-PI-AD]|uniref:FecR domain-containing protein n=1 Tax=Pseudomonas sp. RIT-PI-AD TaxID=3035294 RepID=UPI0021D82555|nr:FecR family protein [Pseudomonas sp. RIT-PI-AD]
MSPAHPVSAQVLDEAIGWQLCLGSGEADPQQRAAFADWHAAHPEHARAWAQLAGLDRQLAAASATPARRALLRATPTARRLRLGGGVLGLLLAVALGLGLLERQRPLGDWLADEVTGGGEQRELLLPDRTRVRLNSRSALDVRFDAHQRRLVLRSGEILVETAHGDPRPFVVGTAEGDLRALGTRFLVRREAGATRLTVLQSAVAAQPAAAGTERIVPEGQWVLMHADRLEPSQPAPLAADAWSHGMLVVENQRLGDLLDALGEYRDGYLGVDPAIADLRISGSFPLYDSDRALAALPPSLPVRIERHTGWWVRVVPAKP